jgi:FMN phosphatase YigB (HAD superfamily)
MFEIEKDPLIHLTSEKLHHLGVKALLFDLDDTLINTNFLFKKYMAYFSEEVATSLNIESSYVFDRLSQINNEEYERFGVDPVKKWPAVLQRLGEELGNPELVLGKIDIIQQLYFAEPQVFPGVYSLLSELKSAGFLIGEVTHGETDWSLRKNEQTGLINYMDAIVAASVHGPKTKEHYLQCMNLLSVSPQECLITGDNIQGDILPAIDLGSRAINIVSPWSVYRRGNIPDKVVQIDHISDFFDAIQKLH